MRHSVVSRRYGRNSAHIQALFRNLTTSLFRLGRIQTTVAKAKGLRPVAEKLITLAGNDSLAARKRAYSYLRDKDVVHHLFAELGPRYRARPGGYTRIVRLDRRPGDAAELAVIELINDGAAAGESKAPSGGAKKHAAAKGKRTAAEKSGTKDKAPAKKAASKEKADEPKAKKEGTKSAAGKPARKKKPESE